MTRNEYMYIIEELNNTFQNILKMSIFNQIKTNNPLIDAIISTLLLTYIGYLLNSLKDIEFSRAFLFEKEYFTHVFYRKNIIRLEGKRSSTFCPYGGSVVANYSNRFKAIWHYIITNIGNNPTIYEISEFYSTSETLLNVSQSKQTLNIFMVSQPKYFKINKDIYAIASSSKEEDKSSEKYSTKTDKTIIKIYSYTLSLLQLQQFIDNITTEYLQTIQTHRLNKKYIYILEKIKYDDEESKLDCWSETQFVSMRKFNNMFFEGKNELIKHIDFFIHNKPWYEKKGIPYSLGIGLHGPPGTGKTSFIKALAHYTGSHIVFLSLKLIKTKSQLEQFFFEDTYNSNNEKHSITFDKKITVIEDIDCIGDIVLKRDDKFKDREKVKETNKNKQNKNKQLTNSKKNDNTILYEALQNVVEMNNNEQIKQIPTVLTNKEELITLDDILNLWDGVRETPGRILIISSNHYGELDPALIRPGRIDITHELKNASHEIIKEMHRHLFESEIDLKLLKKVKEYLYSPAELINIYVATKCEDAFMKRLLENKKIV